MLSFGHYKVVIYKNMSLDQKDMELIERLMSKNTDDIAIAISRSFERLEERIDSAESRTYSRLAEVEDKVESARQDLSDILGEMRDELRAGEYE
jgi:UDP-N-acetylglucosamine pyrophosphorylase